VKDLEDAGLSSLTPAPLANHVKARFLAKCNDFGQSSLVLGYHGTPTKNHDGIFRNGLMIPGKGSVRIANGNAHGRGIYIAEKGAHYLSMGFLRGDSHMLVCGVVDNNLVEKEEETKDAATGTSRLRFQFHGSVLAHRCHRQPPKSKLQKNTAHYMGAHEMHSQTREVRHVGNAMVIFKEDHVAPLYVARLPGASAGFSQSFQASPGVVEAPEPMPNGNRFGQVGYAARQQVVDPHSEEQCWLAPEASTCLHAIKMKRKLVKKNRQHERRHLRECKYEA